MVALTKGMKQRNNCGRKSIPEIITPGSLLMVTLMPNHGTNNNARCRETRPNDADDERRSTELRDVKRQNRSEHGVLRITQKLRRAEQQNGLVQMESVRRMGFRIESSSSLRFNVQKKFCHRIA